MSRLREVAWAVLLLVCSGLLLMARADGPERITTGDSYWYMRQAQIFTGIDPATAAGRAGAEMCGDINRASVAAGGEPPCRAYQVLTEPRYAAIFASRPGLPLLAAPFVAVFGVWDGMIAATMVLALGAVLLAYLAVWLATGRRTAGLVAALALVLLPSGFWLTRMLAEGATLIGFLAALTGVILAWRGRWSGSVLLGAALVWLFAVRSASGMAVALALAAASVLALMIRRQSGAALTGAVAAGGLAAWVMVSTALGLPGLTETIQDYATVHFTLPDTGEPLRWLMAKNRVFWIGRIRDTIDAPGQAIAVAAAVVVLAARLRWRAAPWILVGFSGFALVVAHPVPSEMPRLMVSVWLLLAATAGVACAAALDLRRRRLAQPIRLPDPILDVRREKIMA